jgi:hypothetical protein
VWRSSKRKRPLGSPRRSVGDYKSVATAVLCGGPTETLTASEACALGLPFKVGMSQEIVALMKLYPPPIRPRGGSVETDGRRGVVSPRGGIEGSA